MSQSLSIADIVTEFQADMVANSIIHAMNALTVHDYIITLGQEGRMVWQRKWTFSTWLFIANRYMLCASSLLSALPYTASFVVFVVFSALRVYALWDRNTLIALLVLVLGLVPVVTNIFGYTRQTNVFAKDSVLGAFCSTVFNIPAQSIFEFTLGTRIALCLADILVLVATWLKTDRNRIESIGLRTTLSTILLRDGTIYFVILLVMNIAQVLVDTVQSLQDASPVANIIATLQPILISRFLLNLRQVVGSYDAQDTFNSRFSVSGLRVPTLASVIGNMGEHLDHGPVEEVEDEPNDVADGPLAEEMVTSEVIIECCSSSTRRNPPSNNTNSENNIQEEPRDFIV